MKKETNINTHTLKTYYNIIVAYNNLLNGNIDEDPYMPFLDYCYDIATCEFEDDTSHHTASEFKSHEAIAIICAAERFERLVKARKEEKDWNNLFETAYTC